MYTSLCICVWVCLCVLSYVWLFVTSWTVARQVPLSVEFPRQEYREGCHFLLHRTIPTQGLYLRLLCWQADFLPLCYMGSLRVHSSVFPFLLAYLLPLSLRVKNLPLLTGIIFTYLFNSRMYLASELLNYIPMRHKFINYTAVFVFSSLCLYLNTFKQNIVFQSYLSQLNFPPLPSVRLCHTFVKPIQFLQNFYKKFQFLQSALYCGPPKSLVNF